MQDLSIQAEAFLSSMKQFEGLHHSSMHWEQRLAEIQEAIAQTGSYTHTTEELVFGAKLAWRNSNRCIGRHFWRQLEVYDCRHIDTFESTANALERHIQSSYNKGSIKSTVSIFAPRNPCALNTPDTVRIKNHQLIRYAGFKNEDGSITGDPHSVSFTNACLRNGWKPEKKGRFTPLPWCIQINGSYQPIYDVFKTKPDLLQEVSLEHPENKSFKELGLKWYTTPILSDMALVIGGIVYPCAPFNGWYMGTEIGARNLADQERYNVLPQIAQLFGYDQEKERSLWRDRAIIELNRAVLYSFDRDQTKIGDHHALSRQFEKFCKSEDETNRPVTGDWTWLIPPISSSQTPTFSQEFDPTVIRHTNFFYQDSGYNPSKKNPPDNPTGTSTGTGKCPYHLS